MRRLSGCLIGVVFCCASCRLDTTGTGELNGGQPTDSSVEVPDQQASDAPWQDDSAPPDAEPADVSLDSAGDAIATDATDTGSDETDAPDQDVAADADDDAAEVGVDAAEEEAGPPCAGASVGGYCWYGSAPNTSCTAACGAHGGCNLEGTRDYAGSGGTDANCVAVLGALGYGSYPHQNYSNNDLGCHFAWGSWTYWSTAAPTTCDSAAPGQANAVRMCACNE